MKGNQQIDDRFWGRDEFEDSWKKITLIQFAGPSKPPDDAGEIFRPLIDWGELPIDWQMDILGIDIGRHHEEIAALYDMLDRLADEPDPVSPERLISELGSLAQFHHPDPLAPESALMARLIRADKLRIWKRKEDELDLRSAFASEIEKRPQLSIFDVPSILDITTRNVLLSYLLKTLWEVSIGLGKGVGRSSRARQAYSHFHSN